MGLRNAEIGLLRIHGPSSDLFLSFLSFPPPRLKMDGQNLEREKYGSIIYVV